MFSDFSGHSKHEEFFISEMSSCTIECEIFFPLVCGEGRRGGWQKKFKYLGKRGKKKEKCILKLSIARNHEFYQFLTKW